jgi:hypothetical protein
MVSRNKLNQGSERSRQWKWQDCWCGLSSRVSAYKFKVLCSNPSQQKKRKKETSKPWLMKLKKTCKNGKTSMFMDYIAKMSILPKTTCRFFYLFICAYIVWTISSPYLLPTPSLPPLTLASRQNLFCPFLQFCWREDISIIRKT